MNWNFSNLVNSSSCAGSSTDISKKKNSFARGCTESACESAAFGLAQTYPSRDFAYTSLAKSLLVHLLQQGRISLPELAQVVEGACVRQSTKALSMRPHQLHQGRIRMCQLPGAQAHCDVRSLENKDRGKSTTTPRQNYLFLQEKIQKL